MPMIVKNDGGDFTPAPAGMHKAICVQVLDMGMQPMGQWGDKRRIRLAWEIEPKMSDGRPFLISQLYTLSLNEKAVLRQHLKQWRGRDFTKEELDGFDLEKLLGVGAYLNIVHDESEGRTYANIASLAPLPKGDWPKPQGDLLCFSCDQPDMRVLEKLPEKLGDKITTGMHKLNEGRGKHSGAPSMSQPALDMARELEDEIPF